MSTHNVRVCLSLFLKRALCVGAVLGGGLFAASSFATEATHTVLRADELDLSVPCAQVHIKVDPALKNSMVLETASGLSPAIQTVKDGTESHLHIALKACQKGGVMALRLSGDTALTLHDSPQAHITISGTLTTLESNLDDASLDVDHVESLDLSISGTTQAHIFQLARAAQINATGAARLDVDNALLSALSAQLSDNSQLSIAQGQIDNVTLTGSQQAEASIMATVNNANIITNDAAHVTLNKVTGTVQDGGTKHISHTTPAEPATQPSPKPTPTLQPDGQAQGLNNPALPHVTPAPTPTATPKASLSPHEATPPSTTSAQPINAAQPPATPPKMTSPTTPADNGTQPQTAPQATPTPTPQGQIAK
ncbi:hypothetical protein [Bombella pollinis]|uniref:Auto-transporter adhesin head GIN domain-containing protein n=1 Tax=Bombella pollinis TaxID=2967337 RepID=A0ABT3WIW6_9PROT|nr:hypothetical protein [Bombella pollinis]MCX5619044.1 hypothetical protein [Bombella pollinis]